MRPAPSSDGRRQLSQSEFMLRCTTSGSITGLLVGRSDGLLGGALLHDPVVTVGVSEEDHRAPRLVAVAWHLLAVLEVDDVAEWSAQLGQLGVHGHDVRHDEGRPALRLVALDQMDRATGPWRSELDDAHAPGHHSVHV